jgi:hypothetical protein
MAEFEQILDKAVCILVSAESGAAFQVSKADAMRWATKTVNVSPESESVCRGYFIVHRDHYVAIGMRDDALFVREIIK